MKKFKYFLETKQGIRTLASSKGAGIETQTGSPPVTCDQIIRHQQSDVVQRRKKKMHIRLSLFFLRLSLGCPYTHTDTAMRMISDSLHTANSLTSRPNISIQPNKKKTSAGRQQSSSRCTAFHYRSSPHPYVLNLSSSKRKSFFSQSKANKTGKVIIISWLNSLQ